VFLLVPAHPGSPGQRAVKRLLFCCCSRKAIARVQTSRNVDISQNSNGHISVVRDATLRWLGMLVVLQVLCMLNADVTVSRSKVKMNVMGF